MIVRVIALVVSFVGTCRARVDLSRDSAIRVMTAAGCIDLKGIMPFHVRARYISRSRGHMFYVLRPTRRQIL